MKCRKSNRLAHQYVFSENEATWALPNPLNHLLQVSVLPHLKLISWMELLIWAAILSFLQQVSLLLPLWVLLLTFSPKQVCLLYFPRLGLQFLRQEFSL